MFGDFEFEFRMGMANKKLAPELETIAILSDEQYMHISSSTIREIAELGGDVSSMVPPIISEALRKKLLLEFVSNSRIFHWEGFNGYSTSR